MIAILRGYDKENAMKLWTIQSEQAYQSLTQFGVLRADRSNVTIEGFIPAYDWLISEMIKRIGAPQYKDTYPIWAWYQWAGKRKRRDLRCSGYAKRGTPLVQLTIEIPDNEVVLSYFDDWHYVLSFLYLALTEKEDSEFEEEYKAEGFELLDMNDFKSTDPRLDKYRKRIVESWQSIFDIWKEDSYGSYPINERSIQATFWELKMEQVLKVEHFIAK